MNIIICGRIGSGKTTLQKKLLMLTAGKPYSLERIITYTTRPKRPGEQDGIDYWFKTEKEFKDLIQVNFFAEYSTYDTVEGLWYYGSAGYSYAEPGNKIIVLDPIGIAWLDKTTRENSIIVYLNPDRDILLKRLEKRGDNAKEVERRLRDDEIKFKNFNKFDITLKSAEPEDEKWLATCLIRHLSEHRLPIRGGNLCGNTN